MATPEPTSQGLSLPSIMRTAKQGQPPRSMTTTLADVLLLSKSPDPQPHPSGSRRTPQALSDAVSTFATGSRPGTVNEAAARLHDWKTGVSSLTAAHNQRTVDPLTMRLGLGEQGNQRHHRDDGDAPTYMTERPDGDTNALDVAARRLPHANDDDDMLQPPGSMAAQRRAGGVAGGRVSTFTSKRERKPLDAPTGASGRGTGTSIARSTRRRSGGDAFAVKAVAPEEVDPDVLGKLNQFLGLPTEPHTSSNEGYVARRLRRLRGNASMNAAFRDIVGTAVAIDCKRRQAGGGSGGKNIVRLNVHAVADASPARRRDLLDAKQHRHDERVQRALQRHQRIVDDFVETAALDGERRKEARHSKLQEAWMPFAAFAARTHFLGSTVEAFREGKAAALRHSAAILIQRRVRIFLRGRPAVTPLRAFLIRARFLKRVLTRIRARLRVGQATLVRSFVKKIAKDHALMPVFFAIRRYANQITCIQRHTRCVLARRRAGAALRAVQWERCKHDIVEDYNLVAKRGGLEGATPAMQQDGERAARELAVLQALTVGKRDQLLANYFMSYCRKYTVAADNYRTAALRYCRERGLSAAASGITTDWRALPRITTVGKRKRRTDDEDLPAVIDGVARPVFSLLVPRTTLAMMVRAAARESN